MISKRLKRHLYHLARRFPMPMGTMGCQPTTTGSETLSDKPFRPLTKDAVQPVRDAFGPWRPRFLNLFPLEENAMFSVQKMFLWLCLLFWLPLASAVAQPDLTVGTASGQPGATVTTPVSLTNNGAVVAMSFDITYNPALVTPGTVTAGVGLAPHIVATNIPAVGTLRVILNPPLVAPLPTMNSGWLLTVPWTISASTTPGNAPLALANVVFSNVAAHSVAPGTLTSGQVTITAP